MHRLVASWFGTGLILRTLRGSDAGSGTVGALFAALIAFLIGETLGWAAQLAAVVALIGLSTWSIRPLVDTEGDAGWIVIDEAGGAFLALIGLQLWPGAIGGFLVFRMADIFKRLFPGVSQAEGMPRAMGVVGDDLVAGLYGLAAGHLLQLLL